jgi:septal ring factor EnvC (AmiA/AmiB activator)
MKKTTLLFTTLILAAVCCPPAQAWSNPFNRVKTYISSYFKPSETKPVGLEKASTTLIEGKPSYTEYVANAYRKTASFVSWLVRKKCTQETHDKVTKVETDAQARIAELEQTNRDLSNKMRAYEFMLKNNGKDLTQLRETVEVLKQTVQEREATIAQLNQPISSDNEFSTPAASDTE